MAKPGVDEGDYLIVARVRKPHGLAGEFTIAVETDRPKQVFRPGRVLQLADTHGNPKARRVTIEQLRPATGGAILKVEGVRSREDADLLRGHALLIEAREAAPAGDDEVHYHDLVGLTARTADGEIGRVEDVLDLPGGETLLLKSSVGREILIPFVKEMIAGVDLEARVLNLVLPEGMLEL